MSRKFVLLFLLILGFNALKAQTVREICFHLYTDSLKKGTHNYINVDGKMSDGSWRPLTSRELIFTTDYGNFEGNDLVLPENTTVNKVFITATLRSDPAKKQKITIWIKQKPDPPLRPYRTVGR